jgi:hypothetical protein
MKASTPSKPSPSQMGTSVISPFMVRHLKKSEKSRDDEKKLSKAPVVNGKRLIEIGQVAKRHFNFW